MTNKIKLIRTRNQRFKKLYSNNTQYGGTNLNDDVVPISNIIEFDNEMDKNNKLIDGYLTELHRLYTTITEETGNVSQKELDKLAQDFQVKEETMLAQNNKNIERIKQLEQDKLTNTTEYEQSLSQLEQQKEQLNSTILGIRSQQDILQNQINQINELGGLDNITNQLQSLKQENEKYKQDIAQMEKLRQELLKKQNENTALQTQRDTLQQEFDNLPTKIHQDLEKTLQNYDNKLIQQIQDKENTQVGGEKLKKIQESCKIFACKKKLQRNFKKLYKIYNKLSNVRNKFLNENMKIYVKKNNIKESDIKKELEFLFKNRSKYLNNQTIFIGGQISDSTVYNEVVTNLLQEKLLPHKHVDNIYKKLKTIIKGEVSDSSEAKDILNNVYIAILGLREIEIGQTEKKFLDKATTIKQIGEEIISLLADCDPPSMGVKLSSGLAKIKDQIAILDKLEKLLTQNPDQEILRKAKMYLPSDFPGNFRLSGTIPNMLSNIQSYYNSEIMKYINIRETQKMLNDVIQTIDNPTWQIDEDIKKKLCKDISNLYKILKTATKNLDMNYIVNKYEDISGAVRVYVRINDYSVKKEEEQQQCSVESMCLGRSYVIEKEDDEETKYILARNPCEQDPFYNIEQRQESINKGRNNEKSTYREIDEDILKQYQMLGVQRYGAFFGTYENVTNKDIFLGVDSKSNNPPLKDALLQATQGYSIILFGYGYSGSGKSYTLLNGKDNMLSSFMAEVKNKAGTITIDKISELYGRYIIQDSRMEAKEYDISEEDLKTENRDINFKLINDMNAKKREEQIKILLDTIENYRKKTRFGGTLPATIKGTPNNPASSRSHLFIRIGVKLPNGPTGYLTIVDMAGIENPVEIAINIFPFTDLRRKIDPFKNNRGYISEGQWWADINTKNFTNNEQAKKNLAIYFGKVLDDLMRVEEDVCPKAVGREGRTDWKYLSDCTEGSDKIEINDGYGYNGAYVDFYDIWNKSSPQNRTPEMSYKIMKKIQQHILSQAEAFTLLKDLKEVFLYGRIVYPSSWDANVNLTLRCKLSSKSKSKNVRDTICNSADLIENLNDLLDLWINNLPQNSNQQRHLSELRHLKIMKKFISKSDQRSRQLECEEKYAILVNYCFGCMILNGIIKDFEDMSIKALDKKGNKTNKSKVEYKINTGGELVKQYNGGFLNGVQISESDYLELIEEGIFINETINHLAFYFKKKNKPNTTLKFEEQLKEVVSSLYSTKVYARSQLKPKDDRGNRAYSWDDSIKMSLKTYLPDKFLYDPETEYGWNKNVLIKSILRELDEKSQEGKPSKFIMMCLLRPEIDAKYCTGARATLDFAESVCSTCT